MASFWRIIEDEMFFWLIDNDGHLDWINKYQKLSSLWKFTVINENTAYILITVYIYIPFLAAKHEEFFIHWLSVQRAYAMIKVWLFYLMFSACWSWKGGSVGSRIHEGASV